MSKNSPGRPGAATTEREGIARGVVASEHILQLFDTEESLADSVAAFLAEGAHLGQHLLVVATPRHWELISARLGGPGVDLPALVAARLLTVMNAEELLASFMRRGAPHRALFVDSVGELVTRLAGGASSGLRIYGEMVELLAQEGNYSAAAHLEALWNELGARTPFTLLCGYFAAHFAGPDAGAALGRVCCEHTHSASSSRDFLGNFLLAREGSRPPARIAAGD